jgi:transposase-like protein
MGDSNLLDADKEQAVIEAYQRGDKLRDICDTLGVPRSTVYYILEKHGVSASRVQRGRRLGGGDQELAQLYDLIDAQQKVIVQLRGEVARLTTKEPHF